MHLDDRCHGYKPIRCYRTPVHQQRLHSLAGSRGAGAHVTHSAWWILSLSVESPLAKGWGRAPMVGPTNGSCTAAMQPPVDAQSTATKAMAAVAACRCASREQAGWTKLKGKLGGVCRTSRTATGRLSGSVLWYRISDGGGGYLVPCTLYLVPCTLHRTGIRFDHVGTP